MLKAILSVMAIMVLTAATSMPLHAEDAATIYKAKCQMCHGADGKGTSPMSQKMGVRDFHGPAVAKESDAELFTITKAGKAKMPAYAGKLTDEQIKDLVKFIHSLK
jgi:mono/diheme cytochrome c family protein